MWILTQNGKRILSTEGMDEISVADPIEGKSDFAVMLRRKTDGKPFALGFYEKNECAAAVLGEIFKIQANYLTCQGSQELSQGRLQPGYIIIPPKVYKMPPDETVRLCNGCSTGEVMA